jgi:rhodanese-related sulfurtransferase
VLVRTQVVKHGKIVLLATADWMRSLSTPVVIDARDAVERAENVSGAPIAGSHSVPFNIPPPDGSEPIASTPTQYRAALEASGCLPADKAQAIITHCGGGGRGAKSQKVLQDMGYTNVHNGGSADAIRAAIGR